MSSFWELSTGDTAKSDGEYEVGGGNFDPIPEKTQCLAVIDEAKWDEKEGARFISLRWSVLAPDVYKNRKIYHKLWVADADPMAKDADKKRDKAKLMLAAIDGNAGKKLFASQDEPTDQTLTDCLCLKPMQIMIMQWAIKDATGTEKKGNWIGAVSSKGGSAAATAPSKKPIINDDIPF